MSLLDRKQKCNETTADFMKKVPGVDTHSMETIYLSLSVQVSERTVFRKSPPPTVT